MRIVICGGPRTGKTTHAVAVLELVRCNCDGFRVVDGRTYGMHAVRCDAWLPEDIRLRHTDDLIEQTAHLGKDGWSEASRLASEWLDEPGPWIIEGVAMARALRKWREAHPGEPPPVDRVIRLTAPYETLSKGQAAMAKGEETVWLEIVEWLLAGVDAGDLEIVDLGKLALNLSNLTPPDVRRSPHDE
jgi:hypothetical protein